MCVRHEDENVACATTQLPPHLSRLNRDSVCEDLQAYAIRPFRLVQDEPEALTRAQRAAVTCSGNSSQTKPLRVTSSVSDVRTLGSRRRRGRGRRRRLWHQRCQTGPSCCQRRPGQRHRRKPWTCSATAPRLLSR